MKLNRAWASVGILTIILLAGIFFLYKSLPYQQKNDQLDSVKGNSRENKIFPDVSQTSIELVESHNFHNSVAADKKKQAKRVQNTSLENTHEDDLNNIAECEDADFDADYNKRYKSTINGIKALLPKLNKSLDVEGQLAYRLITGIQGEENDLVDSLGALQTKYPDNTLLSYDLLTACTAFGSDCDSALFSEGVLQEGQNGAMWLLAAIDNISKNKTEMALDALLNAASAPVYNEHWGEHFALFNRAFSEVGASDDLSVKLAVANYAMSIPMPAYGELVSFCKSLNPDQADILNACLRIGERMEGAGTTILSQFIGLALQDAVYKKYTNSQQESHVFTRRESKRAILDQYTKAEKLVTRSRLRTAEWLGHISSFGEIAGMEYAVDEAIRLTTDPDFEPCEIDW